MDNESAESRAVPARAWQRIVRPIALLPSFIVGWEALKFPQLYAELDGSRCWNSSRKNLGIQFRVTAS